MVMGEPSSVTKKYYVYLSWRGCPSYRAFHGFPVSFKQPVGATCGTCSAASLVSAQATRRPRAAPPPRGQSYPALGTAADTRLSLQTSFLRFEPAPRRQCPKQRANNVED